MTETALGASKGKLLWNQFKTYLSKPYNVILLLLGILVTFTTVAPIIAIVEDTFKIHAGTIDAYLTGKRSGFSVVNYVDLFTSRVAKANLWTPLLNTVFLAFGTCIVSIFFGGIVAFLITRTNMAWRKYISSIFIFPYIMPQWTLAVVWQNLFNSNQITGTSNGLMASLFGVYMPLWWCKGLFPSLVVLGLHYAPFAYILIGGIFKNMDANLEEAATILKATRARIIKKITLPIVLPALLSTFLLVFSSSMSAYAVPQFLGGTKGFSVLTTTLRQFINSGWYGQGYIMAIFMIIFGLAILGINQYVTSSRRSFTTVTGKSGQISYIKLGAWSNILAVIIVILCLFFSFMPLVSFALESCTVVPGDFSKLTLKFWIDPGYPQNNGIHGLFFEPQVWASFKNSLILSISCAFFAGTFGILIGYAVAKRRGSRLAKLADNLAFLPYLMPSLALGAAFLAIGMKMGLSKTMTLLILVGSIKYLPFASRSGINAMLQLSGEIEEAAVIVNVSWWKRMLRIIFPIQKSTFISGYLLPFTSCMRELSLFTLLSSGSIYLMTTLLEYWQVWCDQSANALNLLIVVTVLAVNLLINKLTGASIDKGVGG